MDGKLDWVEMRKYLTMSELRRLKRYLGDKIDDRVRVKRIDAITLLLENKLEEINDAYSERVLEFSKQLYEESYYRIAYESQNEKSEYSVLTALLGSKIAEIVLTPWTPDKLNFAKRIAQNEVKLMDKLRKDIAQCIVRGESPTTLIELVKKQFGISVNQAKALINTESTRLVSEASYNAAVNSNVKEYTYRAILDTRTSDICRSMNGMRFKITEYEIGVTAPPLHAHCRSYIVWDAPNGVKDTGIKSYTDWHKKYVQEREE